MAEYKREESGRRPGKMEYKETTERLNKEKQLLYKWTPPCEHALTSGFIWPQVRSTTLSLHGYFF